MTDTDLQRTVLEALGDSPPVHVSEISVEVVNGEVTLRGTVGSPLQRLQAVRVTRAVPGVGAVEDRLEVKLMDFEGRADADTGAAVTDALHADAELRATELDVEVKDGKVALEGSVAYASQRDRAERIALGVGGVSGVDNRLRVLAAVSADEVAERVTDAMDSAGRTGADQVRVSVRDGDVILTGSVSSREHRDAALEAAASAPGVADVHDELRVRG
jgi:osmotically-inducible protein OsmY